MGGIGFDQQPNLGKKDAACTMVLWRKRLEPVAFASTQFGRVVSSISLDSEVSLFFSGAFSGPRSAGHPYSPAPPRTPFSIFGSCGGLQRHRLGQHPLHLQLRVPLGAAAFRVPAAQQAGRSRGRGWPEARKRKRGAIHGDEAQSDGATLRSLERKAGCSLPGLRESPCGPLGTMWIPKASGSESWFLFPPALHLRDELGSALFSTIA